MISLDPSLLQADSDSRRRHAELAKHAGSLTILVRAKSGSADVIQGVDGDSALTLIPFIAPTPLWIVPRALGALRRVTAPVDLIVTQDMFLSAVIGILATAKAPLLVQSHTTIFDNPAWLTEAPYQRRLMQILAGWVLHRADFVRTVNTHEQDAITRRGFPSDRIECLPLGTASHTFVDPPQAQIDAARVELGLSPDDRTILWVGHPIGFKRLPLLFPILRRVLTEIPQARLVLIGIQPEQAARLRPLIDAEGIADQVSLHAPVSHDRLPAYYALADVYVLPSSYEGLPRVLFEAGAAGLPTVAFDVPGVNEVIENTVNGWLVPDGNLDAFAACVRGLLADPALAREIGEQARRIAFKRYAAADYPDRWAAVWRRAVERGIRRKGK